MPIRMNTSRTISTQDPQGGLAVLGVPAKGTTGAKCSNYCRVTVGFPLLQNLRAAKHPKSVSIYKHYVSEVER